MQHNYYNGGMAMQEHDDQYYRDQERLFMGSLKRLTAEGQWWAVYTDLLHYGHYLRDHPQAVRAVSLL